MEHLRKVMILRVSVPVCQRRGRGGRGVGQEGGVGREGGGARGGNNKR